MELHPANLLRFDLTNLILQQTSDLGYTHTCVQELVRRYNIVCDGAYTYNSNDVDTLKRRVSTLSSVLDYLYHETDNEHHKKIIDDVMQFSESHKNDKK